MADIGSTYSCRRGKSGRMTVAQGLFHDRELPAMLMEQMIEYNSKLGRCPTVADRIEFGGGLVRAIVAAVQAGFANVHH